MPALAGRTSPQILHPGRVSRAAAVTGPLRGQLWDPRHHVARSFPRFPVLRTLADADNASLALIASTTTLFGPSWNTPVISCLLDREDYLAGSARAGAGVGEVSDVQFSTALSS